MRVAGLGCRPRGGDGDAESRLSPALRVGLPLSPSTAGLGRDLAWGAGGQEQLGRGEDGVWVELRTAVNSTRSVALSLPLSLPNAQGITQESCRQMGNSGSARGADSSVCFESFPLQLLWRLCPCMCGHVRAGSRHMRVTAQPPLCWGQGALGQWGPCGRCSPGPRALWCCLLALCQETFLLGCHYPPRHPLYPKSAG